MDLALAGFPYVSSSMRSHEGVEGGSTESDYLGPLNFSYQGGRFLFIFSIIGTTFKRLFIMKKLNMHQSREIK